MPGFFSLLGLAGLGIATTWAGILTPVFVLFSLVFLGRAHYLLYWKNNPSKLNATIVWGATVGAGLLWVSRLGVL